MQDWKSILAGAEVPEGPAEPAADAPAAAAAPAQGAMRQQRLIVRIDRKGRAGKQVTLVEGFDDEVTQEEIDNLGRTLKTKCGVGGSTDADGVILQGDLRDKIVAILLAMGHKAKRGN